MGSYEEENMSEAEIKARKKEERARKSAAGGLLGGRPPKYDYDKDEFYDAVFQLAAQGASNAEIGTLLGNRINITLSRSRFEAMVTGNCPSWDEETNARRGQRLRDNLARARDIQLYSLKSTYLKSALGGQKVTTTTTTRRKLRIDGQYTDDEEISTTITESVTQPDKAAINNWLYHYDEEWRRVQRNIIPEDDRYALEHRVTDAEEGGINNNIESGVDISAWIEKECEVVKGKTDAKEENIDNSEVKKLES